MGGSIICRINWADTDTGVNRRYIIITFPGNIRDALPEELLEERKKLRCFEQNAVTQIMMTATDD